MKKFTAADRKRAADIYLAEGATAAALAVGCSRESVYRFLAECDTVPNKKGEEARAATIERHQLKRAAMLELIHDQALAMLAAIDPNDPTTARFAIPACALIDKALLMSGLTTRSGVIMSSLDETQIDRDIRAALVELEDRIRSDSPPWTGHGRPSPASGQNGQN